MAGLLGDALSWIDSKKRIAADRLAQLYGDPVALLERAGYDVKDQLMPFLAAAASGDTPAVLEGLLSSGVAGPLATQFVKKIATYLRND